MCSMTKTLDELIDTMQDVHNQVSVCEFCSAAYCNYTYNDGECFVTEAINYLKQYRNEIRLLDEEHKIYMRTLDEYSKEHKQIETWDELKSMLKKPVWIEQIVGNKIYSGWTVAKEVTDSYLMTNEWVLWKKEFGTVWIAHRKEGSALLQNRITQKLESAGVEMEKSK